MKLRVTFELPLSEDSIPYLNMIARVNGYSENDTELTPEQFVCEVICKKQVSALFQALILNALDAYLGISGRDQVNAVAEQYINTHTVTADIVSD